MAQQLVPGMFGVVRTNGVAARAIRTGEWLAGAWAEDARYNHAFIVISPGGLLMEAQPGGAALGHIREYAGHEMLLNEGQQLTDEQRRVIVATALELEGTPYGWPDIAALGLHMVGLDLPGVFARVEREDRLICSQLVARCYAAAGIDLAGPARTSDEVVPSDLAAFIHGHGLTWEAARRSAETREYLGRLEELRVQFGAQARVFEEIARQARELERRGSE